MSYFFKTNFILLFIICLCGTCKHTLGQSSKFVIEEISIEGNSKTRSNVIYENLPFTIGDSLTEDQIYQAIDDLRSLELFNEIELHPRPGTSPGYLHLIIQVDERYWPRFRFKGGFSELDGWYLTPVSLNLDNIFGLGNYTNLELTFGDRISSVKLNYINPNIFDSNLDFHFRLIGSGREFIHYIDKFLCQYS
jgi:outer membrane protein insertion porin family